MKSQSLTYIKLKPAPEALADAAAIQRNLEATTSLMTAISGLLASDPTARISLEIIAQNGRLFYLIAIPEEWQSELTHHLYAAWPTAELEPLDNWHHEKAEAQAGATVQFSPPQAALRDGEFTGHDPLTPLLEILSAVQPTDQLIAQLLITTPPKSSLTARALNAFGDLLVSETRRTIMGPGYQTEPSKPDDPAAKPHTAPICANLRLLATADTAGAAEALVRRAATAFHGYVIPGTSSVRYQLPRRLEAWIEATQAHRPNPKTAFWLTPAEAAGLYHPPQNPRAFPRLDTITSTRLPIPTDLPSEGILVGFGAFRTERPPIHLAPADRLRHTYIIGATGTGKSTLLQSAILQDMQNGDGCCFIDPHGEAIDWLLPRIPPHRAADVVLFDPSDPAGLLGLNLLEWHTPQERDLLIQELIALFYKLFDPEHTGIIGPQFEHWLRSAALTITEPDVRGTLVDIPRLFTDQPFQQAAVALAQHPAVKEFWNGQMAKTADFHKSEMLNYFTSKFGSFLGNDVMHDILSQRASAFDLRSLMDQHKILLVNLSKGRLGSLNAQLLGTLIVTKLQMAALSRADVPAEARPPFYVYIDEFQNIVTDSFATMLSEIRKYGVALHLAHQYADQLSEPIKQAVAGNIGTLMAFRLGPTDADWLTRHFDPLTPGDLTALPTGQYHLRMLANGRLTTPFTVAAPRVKTTPQPALELALRNRVRQFVAATRAVDIPAPSNP